MTEYAEPPNAEEGRLAELLGALSLATDLGMGQPMEHGLRCAILSVRAGQSLGLASEALSDLYYLALLRFIGCTADAHEAAAAVGGDEIAFRSGIATVLMADTSDLLRHMVGHYAEGQPTLTRARLLGRALLDGKSAPKRTIAEHCEVALVLAPRLGIREVVASQIGSIFERWDGSGLPGELAGEGIPVAARIAAVARDVELLHRAGGWALAADVLKQSRARAYDPAVADAFLQDGPTWLVELDQVPIWETVLDTEPAPHHTINSDQLDEALGAFAAFIDLKSPFTLLHSTEVAELAAGAAAELGLSEADVRDVRRAGLVHDLGKAGVPNGIWDKPVALVPSEWERVRSHSYSTERVLSYAAPLRPLARLAGSHHERLDGSGYHRGSASGSLGQTARVLAAADVYQAMTQERPYRPALDQSSREQELTREAASGRLDQFAVQAVLTVAGHTKLHTPRAWPRGLTDREVEVLRLISTGRSKREVADALTISPKTVGRHVENIYAKIGVASRAAAALFAMEHRLL